MSPFRTTVIALAFVGALANGSLAAAENVLRFTGKDAGAATMDPHSYAWRDNEVATKQVYEALLDIDSNLAIVPQLALTWKPLDPTTWEFELRRDVTFHDGAPFTAEDVVFSIERARAETSDYQESVDGITAVEAIDAHTVRIKTFGPDPSLWLKLAKVAIMSKAWVEEHGVARPADYVGAREETYASRHASGTGPFTVEAFEPRGDYTLIRNPDWWGQAAYPHDIDRVVHIRKVDPENVTALLEGEIDLLQTVPYWAIDQIRDAPHVKLVHRTKLHTTFFGFDQGTPELRSSNINGRNPFNDRRVRLAMAHAIDIETILRGLMGELLIPAKMIPAPGVNGHSAEVGQTIRYDPEKGRALLVDAGYPNGFSVTLDCANDWGDDEIATCEGVAEQLSAVGVEVDVNFMPTDEWETKVYNRQSDFYLDGWHMSPDSEELLRKLFHTNGEWNAFGYANPRVDELIGKIETEMVTYARDAYLEEAWRIVTEDLVYLPVRHGVSVFALREDLEIPPDPWDVPRFRLARFK